MKINLSKLSNKKGVTAIIVVLLMVVFLSIAALAIDIGYLAMTKNECQNAADAAALAGGRHLGENYANKIADPKTDVESVAKGTAKKNIVAGQNLADGDVHVKIGTWNSTTKNFTETAISPMAVQVTTTAAANTFFAQIFNLLNMNTGATATAIIGGPCEGEPGIPLGISETWFNKNPGVDWCGTEIILGDTKDSCAGWTNLSTTDPYKQGDVQDLLEGLHDGTIANLPEASAGDNLGFGGGTVTPILEDLLALFNDKKSDEDGNPATPDTWTTTVFVYSESGTCSNPGGSGDGKEMIIGFTTIRISRVEPNGTEKGLTAQVMCQMSTPEPGGCFSGGTLGTIPRLVQ